MNNEPVTDPMDLLLARHEEQMRVVRRNFERDRDKLMQEHAKEREALKSYMARESKHIVAKVLADLYRRDKYETTD